MMTRQPDAAVPLAIPLMATRSWAAVLAAVLLAAGGCENSSESTDPHDLPGHWQWSSLTLSGPSLSRSATVTPQQAASEGANVSISGTVLTNGTLSGIAEIPDLTQVRDRLISLGYDVPESLLDFKGTHVFSGRWDPDTSSLTVTVNNSVYVLSYGLSGNDATVDVTAGTVEQITGKTGVALTIGFGRQ